MEENAQRPLIVEIDDAKQEIINVVNKAIQRGLPCYLISPIIENIYREIQNGAQNELKMAKQQIKNEEKRSD